MIKILIFLLFLGAESKSGLSEEPQMETGPSLHISQQPPSPQGEKMLRDFHESLWFPRN